MPLPQDIARRSPAEYVYSTAQLFRRAGKRHMALNHYHRELKRSLGRPFRINADLPDEEFINELARFREIDRAELSRVLRALSRSDTSERALCKIGRRSHPVKETWCLIRSPSKPPTNRCSPNRPK